MNGFHNTHKDVIYVSWDDCLRNIDKVVIYECLCNIYKM